MGYEIIKYNNEYHHNKLKKSEIMGFLVLVTFGRCFGTSGDHSGIENFFFFCYNRPLVNFG